MSSLSENSEHGFSLSENGSGLAETTSLREDLKADPGSAGGRTATPRSRPGGRPRKPSSERRTHKYLVSANEAEARAIEAAAAAAGLKPSVYLRQAGAGTRLSKRRDDLLYHRLSRIGVRLQQLAQRAGADGRADEQAVLEGLLQEVVELRADL